MSREQKTIHQTIRLEPKRLAEMLEDLRMAEQRSLADCNRKDDRVWINKRILVNFLGKNSSDAQYEAFVRNISSTGICFVHGVYIYPDTPCTITIHTHSGEQQCISAVVTRCRHITSLLHEVGAKFESEIELEEFVDPRSIPSDNESKPDDISSAVGTILIIDDCIADQRLMRHALSKSSLEFIFADDGASALAQITDVPVMVICDLNLPDTDGLDLIKKIRTDGYAGPIIMATGEEDPEFRTKAIQAGAMDYVIKPCPPADLRAAVMKALAVVDQSPMHGTAPIISTADPEEMPSDLVKQFVDDLAELSAMIESSLSPINKDVIREKALMVKGSALGYGFAPLMHAANTLVKTIDEDATEDEITGTAKILLSTCRRAAIPSDWI